MGVTLSLIADRWKARFVSYLALSKPLIDDETATRLSVTWLESAGQLAPEVAAQMYVDVLKANPAYGRPA